MKVGSRWTMFTCMVVLGFCQLIKGDIPYPQAISNSKIVQNSIDNIDSKGMIIGNGDINALIWSQGSEIRMRVSKNDAWDARLITANDPDGIPWVNVTDHTWGGHNGNTQSWNNPYPALIYPAEFIIGSIGTGVTATIDLEKAVADIESSSGTIKVRALRDRNVFLVETSSAVTMYGSTLNFIPTSTQTQTGDVNVLRQNLPGDPDYPGMDIYVAVKANPTQTIRAISIVTSREDPLASQKAVDLVNSALNEPLSNLISAHETIWNDFWSQSGIELNDKVLERWWYRMLYWFGSMTKPGSQAVGLKGGWNKIGGWHGDYHTNYNMSQPYWTSFNTNHPELAKPMIEMLSDYHPRAKYYANTVYNLEGGALTISLFPFEPDPAVSVSKNKRMMALNPWGMTIGMASHMAQNLWLHFQYGQDTTYLQTKSYPVMKDYAIFYADFLETCAKENGKAIFGPSYDPEHGPMGIDNSPYDIAFAKYSLTSAIAAAKVLNMDGSLITRWENALNVIPDYPTQNGIIVNWRNGAVNDVQSYNIPTPTVPVFPGEMVSLYSDQTERDLLINTIRYMDGKTNRNNANVMLNVSRARMGLATEAYTDTRTWYLSMEQSNGLFRQMAHGYYFFENVAVAGLVGELLIQSNEDVIRVFPAIPQNENAKFTDLRAQGGFLINAEQRGGVIGPVSVKATVGGTLKFVSPWSTINVRRDSGVFPLTPGQHNIVQIETSPGETVVFDPTVTTIFPKRNVYHNQKIISKMFGNNLQIPKKLLRTGGKVSIYELSGKVIFSKTFRDNKSNVTIPTLEHSHIYLVEITYQK